MVDLIQGPIIVTKYVGWTDHLPARVLAIHRRDNEKTWRTYLEYDDSLSAEANHFAVASKLLREWPFSAALRIVGRGHDAAAYFWLCSTDHQCE